MEEKSIFRENAKGGKVGKRSSRLELIISVGLFLVIFQKNEQKEALAESLGAGHVFPERLGRFLDLWNFYPLAPAQADHVFPFPAPSTKGVLFSFILKAFWRHLESLFQFCCVFFAPRF